MNPDFVWISMIVGCMEQEKRAILTWRKTNEILNDYCVVEHDRLCGVSVLVWADISYDGSKDLYVIRNGSLNSVRYMNEIIARIVGSPLVTISF